MNIPNIIQTPSFSLRKIKYYDKYSTLYGQHTDSGETYIYIEQTSKKKMRHLTSTFYKINRIVDIDFVRKILEYKAKYDLSEVEVEKKAGGGGYPSGDGDNQAPAQ